SAVLPSADNATLEPNAPSPLSPPPVSFSPCCVQVSPVRVNTHAAPARLWSASPPISAVLPSADSATLNPKRAVPISPPPVSFSPCWVQVSPERVNTHAAPTLRSSACPPISAVLPSADSATLEPNWPKPDSPPPVSFPPCWVQVDPERVNTHAA